MATPKNNFDPTSVTINQLMELTGCTFRTVKKRLAGLDPISTTGNAIYYKSTDALPRIYQVRDEAESKNTSDEFVQPQVEKAMLDKRRREKVEIEIDVLKGKLIEANRVEKVWADLVIACRAKLLGIPTKLAPTVIGILEVSKIESLLRDNMREALDELSNYDAKQFVNEATGQDNQEIRTTDDSESE